MTSSNTVEEILSRPYRVSDEQGDAILSNAKYTRVIEGAEAGAGPGQAGAGEKPFRGAR